MSSPIVHVLFPALIVRIFTKDIRYIILAAAAGALPDIDGIFILFDPGSYYLFHHEILHPLLVGVCFAILFALVLRKLFKMNFFASFFVFTFAWSLHSLTDVFLSNWYVRLFWPISYAKISMPISSDFFVLFVINVLVALMFLVISAVVFNKEVVQLYFVFKKILGKLYLRQNKK